MKAHNIQGEALKSLVDNIAAYFLKCPEEFKSQLSETKGKVIKMLIEHADEVFEDDKVPLWWYNNVFNI